MPATQFFENGEMADRDMLEPKHFAKWVEFAKKRNMGIDFNPTFFSHEKANPFTLSSPDEEIRQFWIRHGQTCIRISQYFAEELGQPCVMNIWIPDGYKDIPADRLRLRESVIRIPFWIRYFLCRMTGKSFTSVWNQRYLGSGWKPIQCGIV